MLDLKEIASGALKSMHSLGMDKAQALVRETTTHEVDLQSGGNQLFRTIFDHSLSLRGIRDRRQAKVGGNNLSPEGVRKTLDSLPEGIEASPQDDAYDIADVKADKEFSGVPKTVDFDKMLSRATDFISWAKARYPKVIFESILVKYVENREIFANSNGIRFAVHSGCFLNTVMFTAKDGEKTSSFDFVSMIEDELGGPIQASAGLEELLTQSVSHLEPKNISGKFVGDIIMTPFFLGEFLDAILEQLSTGTLMTGQSLYQHSLNKKIFSEQLSLTSDPLAKRFAAHDHYTGDGFLSETMPVIENGILKSYLVGQYGAQKLNLARAKSDGSHMRIHSGSTPRAKMIADVERGILLTRLSAGRPSTNGDFSGVAKNSFYLENGKIVCPIKEVMISGNYAALLNDVKSVSAETLNFGTAEFPWIHCGGATIT